MSLIVDFYYIGSDLRCWPISKPAKTVLSQIFGCSLNTVVGSRMCALLFINSKEWVSLSSCSSNFAQREDLKFAETITCVIVPVGSGGANLRGSDRWVFITLVKQPLVDFAPFKAS